MAQETFLHADGEDHLLRGSPQEVMHLLEMFGQQFGRSGTFANPGSIEDRESREGKSITVPVQMHRFGCPAAQIDRDQLIDVFGFSIEKWQFHYG